MNEIINDFNSHLFVSLSKKSKKRASMIVIQEHWSFDDKKFITSNSFSRIKLLINNFNDESPGTKKTSCRPSEKSFRTPDTFFKPPFTAESDAVTRSAERGLTGCRDVP
jgi:hypothetical protein